MPKFCFSTAEPHNKKKVTERKRSFRVSSLSDERHIAGVFFFENQRDIIKWFNELSFNFGSGFINYHHHEKFAYVKPTNDCLFLLEGFYIVIFVSFFIAQRFFFFVVVLMWYPYTNSMLCMWMLLLWRNVLKIQMKDVFNPSNNHLSIRMLVLIAIITVRNHKKVTAHTRLVSW